MKIKTKKIITKIMIGLCIVSTLALLIVLFTSCSTSLNIASRNLNNYTINIDYNSSLQTLECSEKVTYINKSDTTLNYLAFHLYPNAFREESIVSPVSFAGQHRAYPNGLDYGHISINSVSVSETEATYGDTTHGTLPTYGSIDTLIKNKKLSAPSYFIGGEDENILYVLFPNTLYPDESIEIFITFFVKIPNINHRFGYGNDTVNIGNFYPIACVFENGEFETSLYNSSGDPFYSDMANYSVTLKAPESFIVSNTGYIVEESKTSVQEKAENSETEEENSETEFTSVDKNTYKIQANAVRDFAIVMSEKFTVISQKVDDTEVKYYYFSDENPTLSLETSVKSLQTFNEIIGKYPYSTLSVVEANFVHGGMEYPNLVYISNEVEGDSYQQVIIHEIAHQWWYNLVGNSEISHSWLDEGLTEYSTVLFYELHPEYGLSRDLMIRVAYTRYDIFLEVYSKVFGNIDTSMNRDLDEFNSEEEYTQIAYVKGMLLFDSLREILGYKKFLKCLQGYFNDYSYKNATPADMISSFEKTSGVDLESYFNAWISGTIILIK